MPDFACVPVCLNCRQTETCDKPPLVHQVPKRARYWAPNMHGCVLLQCGCRELPWPIMQILGEHIDKVLCDLHDWQPLAKERKKPVGKKRKAEINGQQEIPDF